ncbi:dihydropteroate synthase [Halobellus limi]|uniref:Probable bifunctional folylpolyglutamate synthase/dihydropteroate synthase n=1 Tax=Halobellus limi TaxID=699433 RepID=A0A1H6CTV6_9EURY|nr:dihydropteroate synthase [Halobellus limi]QCC49132.1 dihydropteroate synthase [Halobellus limi]SEG76440.1 dihydropteroate synthase [Halobellus limi]
MKYHEAADYLTSFQRRRPKLGIETTARMLSHFGDPQDDVDCVQIAGSNGKGSTARMLESVLRRAGLNVGLFTSPGLNDFREQVRVDGRKVPKSLISTYAEELTPCIDRLRADDDEPTHFEVLTAVALRHFSEMDVDVAILEVGIGGRYDATSAVDPVASAVTSVSLEHTELLGETVEEIARDKAQVAPKTGPLVTGADGSALEAIREVTDVVSVGPERGDGADAPDVVAVESGMRSAVESVVSIAGPDWSLETNLPLLGSHQACNAGVAATLARQIADVDTDAIADGLRSVVWPGRFEIMSTEPMVVLDGSHNPGAAATLADLLGRYDYDDLHLVFGAMADKAYGEMVDSLPEVETAYATRPDLDRAEHPGALAETLSAHAGSVETVASVPEATERAIEAADPDDFVLVSGSLYTVAEARDRWTRRLVPTARTRGSHVASSFVGASFDRAADAAATGTAAGGNAPVGEMDRRVFRTYLRKAQAERVAELVSDVGGGCRRSTAGSPEKLVATVIAGTSDQLRTLVTALSNEGLGLRRVATQLDEQLGPIEPSRESGLGPLAGEETAVMGILNVTPDSFHDGGEYEALEAAVERAEAMVEAGADIVDVGGESTRPGADPVPAEEEIDRVVPVIEALSELDVPVSVDTWKASVADAALDAGADIVNDVSGLADPEMPFVVADHDAALVLMHSLSIPVDPDSSPIYDDVVEDVIDELGEQLLRAQRAGIDRDRIVIDPGCGFGKSPTESYALVDRAAEFSALGCPVLIGHSRKSMYEAIDYADDGRLTPTVAGTALAADRGADVVRVHDVRENAAAIRAVDGRLDPDS